MIDFHRLLPDKESRDQRKVAATRGRHCQPPNSGFPTVWLQLV